MRVVGSPFAPNQPGDQTRPIDQHVALYCQGILRGVLVDAGQAGRDTLPRLQDPQHLLLLQDLGVSASHFTKRRLTCSRGLGLVIHGRENDVEEIVGCVEVPSRPAQQRNRAVMKRVGSLDGSSASLAYAAALRQGVLTVIRMTAIRIRPC